MDCIEANWDCTVGLKVSIEVRMGCTSERKEKQQSIEGKMDCIEEMMGCIEENWESIVEKRVSKRTIVLLGMLGSMMGKLGTCPLKVRLVSRMERSGIDPCPGMWENRLGT